VRFGEHDSERWHNLAAMTTSETVLTTVIAAATSLLVAVASQFLTWRRERTQRSYDRRRSALLDAQDAALVVRNRLGEYGEVSRIEPLTEPTITAADAQRRLDDALAALAVSLTRVDDEAVVGAALAWRDQAKFHSISGEDVTDTEEIAAWDAMNAAFGSALKSSTGVSRGPARGNDARW
jgi:hypothetical protein